MLTTPVADQIKDFVRQEPRTIDEIAKRLRKSWLTADRYVDKIAKEDGTLRIKTFRGGTRGALKLVYWNSTNAPAMSSVQEKLFHAIVRGRRKEDFSPLDIYQFVAETKRNAIIERGVKDDSDEMRAGVDDLFAQAKKQILIFSGNLSWSNLRKGKASMLQIIEDLAKQGVSIKILTRVDIAGIDNIHRMLALNKRIGKDLIEVRHCEQPLRAFVMDESLARLKEVKKPEHYKKGELDAVTNIYYTFNDQAWVAWMQRVFWYLFAEAVSAENRIRILRELKA